MSQTYVPSIGMEVHAELATKSKMFCGCPVGFGGEPNTRVCPVCTGQPGTLPVPNLTAIEMVLRTALALNCAIPERSVFHRKNYFYPDLPKGYQISQYEETNPLGYSGYLEIPSPDGLKKVHIRRVHLEEDTGKLVHLPTGESGVDYNRSGVPLMEIVTEFPPDMHSAEEAREYLVQLRLLMLYLGVCDGRMEQGSLRGEPNISVAPPGSDTLGVKTEIKNLSSLRAVQLGIESEVRRQADTLAGGGTIVQQTLGWNEEREVSFVMRSKEFEQDYRYFPDPDLPPMAISREWVERLRETLPELPMARRARYVDLGVPEQDAAQVIADPALAGYFDAALAAGADPRKACNWITGDFTSLLKQSGGDFTEPPVSPAALAELIELVDSGRISGRMAKNVFAEAFRTGRGPVEIVKEQGGSQISDREELRAVARQVLNAAPSEVEKYRSGKTNVMSFFVGQMMKATQGRANPGLAQEILREELDKT